MPYLLFSTKIKKKRAERPSPPTPMHHVTIFNIIDIPKKNSYKKENIKENEQQLKQNR